MNGVLALLALLAFVTANVEALHKKSLRALGGAHARAGVVKIALISTEQEEFEVTLAEAQMSGLVKQMVIDTEEEDEEADIDNFKSEDPEAERKQYYKEQRAQGIQVPDDGPQPVALPDVKSSVLEKVVKFMKFHANSPMAEIERPLGSANMEDNVAAFDAEFIDGSVAQLRDIIRAAKYMRIPSLQKLAYAKIGSMLMALNHPANKKTKAIHDLLSAIARENSRLVVDKQIFMDFDTLNRIDEYTGHAFLMRTRTHALLLAAVGTGM